MNPNSTLQIRERPSGEPGARHLDVFNAENEQIASVWQAPDPDPGPEGIFYPPKVRWAEEVATAIEQFYADIEAQRITPSPISPSDNPHAQHRIQILSIINSLKNKIHENNIF